MPFYRSLDARIQHGGRSDIVSQYRSLGFYYLRKRPVLRQTDFIDVANPTSEQAHGYQAAASKLTGQLEAAYEGIADETLVRDQRPEPRRRRDCLYRGLERNNDGVRLVRRLDQNGPSPSGRRLRGRPAGRHVVSCRSELVPPLVRLGVRSAGRFDPRKVGVEDPAGGLKGPGLRRFHRLPLRRAGVRGPKVVGTLRVPFSDPPAELENK